MIRTNERTNVEGEAPEAGVMPARPAITPLRRATVEGLFFAHEMNSHTIPDEQAAICTSCVVRCERIDHRRRCEGVLESTWVEATAETATEPARRADPALKPNHPIHRRAAPSAAMGKLEGGNSPWYYSATAMNLRLDIIYYLLIYLFI